MLYNKYRPKLFKDLIGQNFSKSLLLNILNTKSEIHSFIFYGPNGTGKTTVARLFAQALNCSKFKKFQEICTACSTCKTIVQNECTDILEIDGATHNGIEYIREIIRNSVYPPLQLEKKLYIIDEAHCLSSQSWNALLKLIEEPPAHLVLIFITTAIHKIIPTILSRCQKLHFPPLTSTELLELLQKISSAEKKQLEPNLLLKLAENANGSAREALVLLEKSLLNTTTSANLLKNLDTLEKEALKLLKLIFQSNCLLALESVQQHLANIERLWTIMLDKLLELSFFELSSYSTELLSCFTESEAKEWLGFNPNLNSMINFLAPILSNNTLSNSLAYSKFILLNLLKTCTESAVIQPQKTKAPLKTENSKLVNAKETVSLTIQSTQIATPTKIKQNNSTYPKKNYELPSTPELFSHNLLLFEATSLPDFPFEQLLTEEKEILSLLRAVDKKVSKENFSLLQKYLFDEEKNPSIVKLFSKMHPKYELICSNDCCIAVFETEAESKYFNLKTKSLEIKEKLYDIFTSEIRWRGITLAELHKAVKKNKKYKFVENTPSPALKRSHKLFEEVKERYFPENLVKKN